MVLSMAVNLVTRRGFVTSRVILLPKSSDVITSKTQAHLTQKAKLQPKISFRESIKQWSHTVYNADQHLQAKQDSLMRLAFPGYYQGELNGLRATNNKIPIDARGNYLNEIKIDNGDAPLSESVARTNNLVMIHGYAASLGLFYKNFHDVISSQPDARIFALDLPGFGLSSKSELDLSPYDRGTTEFDLKFPNEHLYHAKHVHSSLKLPNYYEISASQLRNYSIENNRKLITTIEDYYIDALEQWRQYNKLENFTLLGHSLGGYLSIAYALKYPSRVQKLVLVSPGGVERSPFAITNPRLKTSQATGSITLKPSMSIESYDFLGRYPIMSNGYRQLWKYQISPFMLLRKLGPFGYNLFYKNLFKKLARNLSNFEDVAEVKTVIDYTYNATVLKSNAERLLMKLFASNVVGKYPMFDRIQDLQPKKTIWLFGEFDYMYNSIGEMSAKKMTALGLESEFKIVPKSGHNLFLDNWKHFNKELKSFLNWN